MAKRMGGNMPQTEQKKYYHPGQDTCCTTAIPRCMEHDLAHVPSRTRTGVWGDEQTFHVEQRGNKVTEGSNY